MPGLPNTAARRVGARAMDFLTRHFSSQDMGPRQIVSLLIPILVDQAFVLGLGMLNTAMVASSGVEAVSAVSMVDSLNLFLVQVFIAVATGGTVVVAQYKGSGNPEMAGRAAAQAVSAVALIATAVSLLVIVFHNPVLDLLFGRAEPAVMNNARLYLIGCCVSYPFFGIVEAACGALRGMARTKSSLVLSLVMNVSYVLLNVLFVALLGWGVAGLIVSLITARVLGAVVSLLYLLRMDHALCFEARHLLSFEWVIQKKIFYIGLPFAAEQMFFHGGKILTQTFIVQLGTLPMTVNAICNSLAGLLQIGAGSINLAVVTVVGQCMGRRDIEGARRFVKSFLLLASASFVAMTLLLAPLFGPLVALFHPPAGIVPDIRFIMMMTALCDPFFWPISFILPSALRAAGDSRFTSVVSLLTMWLVRVVLGYVLGIVLGFSIAGVWAAMVVEWCARGLVFYLRFRGTKWYSHRLID